ncbi:DMT family transporter [Coraliomargarita sp. SDUM461004]|uniref:DMT family transporter n=1 Tax=Thalassobacterium sedimentorum TaxID=3041258 RepID=A0ABU1AL66_9BACT|nr:DMT family transporter [Coraliomargarita sp. SDUM461004]MDQ8195545.1 DMT family transporter [Coraliomargarita sp. SDUM461004]
MFPQIKVLCLTALTLIAFAGNSVLCRLALEGAAIDPYSFTSLRLLGAVMVLVPLSIWIIPGAGTGWAQGSWRSGFALYAYAAAFSMAYRSLSSGTGALILFGAVQITMLLAAHRQGERMHRSQWTAFAVAIAGIVYLVSPGVSAPDPLGALLMLISGIAWGAYSIAGRGRSSPILTTSGNFLRAAPFALASSVCAFAHTQLIPQGIALALLSGGLTSGLGYVLWYTALPKLTTTQAAIAQLLVPLLATLGGIVYIDEQFTLRLAIASTLMISGVAWSMTHKRNCRDKNLPTN